MKKLIAILILSAACSYSSAQNYLMSNTNVSTCGGTFYDGGGAGSNYSNNQNVTMTFCSSTAGQCISISFTSFNLENGYDFLSIYNGPNTASPLLGTFTGTTTPGTFLGTSGCLTFVFTSDIIVNAGGWVANISCIACAAGGSCLQTCNGGPAPSNDACSGAQNLGLIPVPAACPSGIGAWQYTNTTNLCATAEMPYTTLTGCKPSGNMASPASDVWYRFNLTGPTLNVQITGGIQTPNVALYSGTNCTNLVGRGCAIGAGGTLNTSFVGLAAGTYYLQVSGGSLTDQCDFTLGLQNNYDCAGCVIVNNLTVNPPPVNGTYLAGQLVNFCYTISDYNQTSSNWLHAVVPTFGAGWDMSTLTVTMPNNCSGDGVWGWYNTNIVSSATGVSHGPGFYYESPLGSPFGFSDGNPGNNFGDYNPLNLCDWTFCWSIRTKSQAQCVQGASLNISIDTYGDGESGSWTSLACTGDPITEFFATSACCQPPIVNVTNPNCPGGVGSALGTAQGASPWSYIWKNSAGTTIMQLNNVSSSNALPNLVPGNYSLTTVDNNGCAATTYFTVAAPPAINLSVNTVATKCNRNDGAINISASGGTAPLQYSIDNGATYNSLSGFTNLVAGSYTVVVRDANGCTSSQTVNVAPSVVPVINATPTVNVTCNGGSNGSITINASSGTPPLQYSIDNGATFQAGNAFSGLAAGSYTVMVTDVYGCTVTSTVSVTNPPAIVISGVVTADATCGSSNGSLTVNASGGTGALQYSITGGAPYQSSNSFSNLAASNYSVVVVDANGCTVSTNASINNSSAPVINSSATTALLCNGGSNATITINATGGSGALQYSIDNGVTFQSGNIFNGLGAGSYSVVVTDAVGCQVTTSVSISDPPALQINASVTGSTCSQANGSLTINASGGTGALQYSSDNGATFQSGNIFNGLPSGNYTLQVQDANGCTASLPVVVPDAASPVIDNVIPVSVSCFGSADGNINITASGGTGILQYSLDNGVTFQSGNNFSGLTAGTYSVVVTDENGCTANTFVFLTEPSQLTVNTVVVNTTCSQSNGSVTVNANGGTLNYQYSIDAGSTFQSANSFAGLATGSFTVVIQDANGCSVSTGVNITDAPGPRIDATNITDATCYNANNGTLNINASNGTAPLQYSITGGAPYQSSNNFSGLAPGNYSVVVIDANGCTVSTSVVISEPTQIVISSTPTVDANCFGANNGSITINANGGTSPLQYSIDNGSTYQPGNNFSGLSPNTYQIIVQDANGCTATASVNITEPTQVVISSTPTVDANCFGANNGSITINAGGGTGPLQYSIDNGNSYQSGNSFSGLSPNTYQIIVQDANGCTATASVNITEPTQVVISSTPTVDANCFGANNGSITINAGGGTSPLQYSIDNGSSYQSGNSFSGLSPNTYQIIVQDANGCTATSSVSVTEPTQVVISSTSTVDANCFGANNGSITINANGGTSPLQYSIDNGSSYQPGNNFSGLSPNTYQIIVQDANGCTATASVNITEPTQVVISSTPTVDANCFGANNGSITINANGGTSPLQYSIDNGSNYQSGNSFSGLSPNTYQIIVQDANGCNATASVSVTEPLQITYTSAVTDANCGNANGTININGNGGTAPLQYSIDNGSTFQSNGNFGSLLAGNYQVVITDVNGCSTTGNIAIQNLAAPVINNVSQTDITCNGLNNGSLTISANGGTGALQYSIDNGNTFSSNTSFSNLAPGNYQIIVQDASGCQASSAIIIVEPAPLVLVPSITGTTCSNANGAISINANGGTSPYQFSSDNGNTYQTSSNFSNLNAGSYNIVVSDANGCTSAMAAVVTDAPSPVINAVNVNDLTCNGSGDGAVTINTAGGTTPLQFSIDNGNSYLPATTFNALSAGTYQILIQDANGCTASSSAIVTEPAAIVASAATVNANCGQADGSASINASGGTGALQYSINNGVSYQSSSQFAFLTSGNYTVIVQDANGCTVSVSATVNSNAAPVISAVASSDITCYGAANGSVTVNANGGTGALQYSIDNGNTYQSSGVFNNLTPGNYAIVVTDASGCTTTSQATLTEPDLLTINASAQQSTCGLANGDISVTAAGGTSPYSFSNDNGSTFQPQNTFSGLVGGNYQVIIQDANGCTASSTINVPSAPSPVINNVTATPISCSGLTNGNINVTVTGGSAPLQFSIDNGTTFQAGNNFSNLNGGNYQIIVQDANGCTATAATSVSQPSPITLSAATVNANCNQADGSVTVNASGGTGAFVYSLDHGSSFQQAAVFNFLPAGNYTIIIQDANGCMDSVTAAVSNNAAPVISAVNGTDVTCNGLNNGTVSINASGGTGTLQYSVNNGATYQSSPLFSNVIPGSYTVVVQDASGCTVTSSITVAEPPLLTFTSTATGSTCGNANGNITISSNGGTSPYQYSSDNGLTFQTTNQFSSLASGNYQLVITDANGCSASSAVQVGSDPSPVINNVAHTDLNCNGSGNGTITISVSNGTAPVQYSIDNGATFQSANAFANLSAGSYQVLVQDANGCTVSSSAILSEPQSIALTTSSTDATCGNANGTLTVSAAGGSGILTYSIDGGVNYLSDSLFLNLLAGNYNVVVQDANGCTSSVAASVLNTASPVVSSSPVTNVSCFGYNDGSVVVNVTGGTGTLSYSINGGITSQSSNIFSSLTSGNYTVLVTDAQGCSVTANVIITEPDEIVINIAVTDASCGVSNGSITLNASGGAGTLQYSINNGSSYQAGGSFPNQGAGNYQIIVQDANGCIATDVASISNTNAPVISNVSYSSLTCNGSNDGMITISATGGTGALQYSIDNGNTYSAANAYSNLAQGNYSIIVQDAAGCQSTYSVQLTEPDALLFNTGNTPSTCGNANGALTFNVIGGTAPFNYSIDNGVSFQSSNSFTNLAANTYNVVVQDDNGCMVSAQSVITNQAAPSVTNVVAADVKCFGLANGSVTVNANGGTGALQYSVNNGSTFQSGNYFSNLPQGNYQIVVQDANGCTATSSAIIQQPVQLVVSAAATGTTCSNANGLINVTAAGGVGILTYSSDSGITYQASAQFNLISAGSYTVVVQDSNHCTAQTAVTVTDAPGPVLSPSTIVNVLCNGFSNGSISVNASGGTSPLTYSINNGSSYQTSAQFSNLAVGTYGIVVSDANGCTVSSSELITQPAPVNFTLNVTAATCGNSNGTITVANASGGAGNYQFSVDGGNIWQTSVMFDSLNATTYTVVLQDGNACTATQTTVINNISGPVISNIAVTDLKCNGDNGGAIVLTQSSGTGPFQYSINNGQTLQMGNVFNNLAAGNYDIIVVDQNGCVADSFIVVNEPPLLTYSVTSSVATCGNANAMLTLSGNGGTGAYQYSVNGGITYQPSGIFAGLPPDTYQIIVVDSNNCQIADSIAVSSAPAPILSLISSTNISCYNFSDGSVNLSTASGTSPFSYSLDRGVTWQSSTLFNGLPAGNYMLYVQDANGCLDSVSAALSQPAQLITQTASTAVLCNGGTTGTATVNASGGTGPYTYNWNVPGNTTQTVQNIAAGVYTVVVTDANNCSTTDSVNVKQPPLLMLTATTADVSCFGFNNGSVTVAATGGTGAIQYSIDGGMSYQSGLIFDSLPPNNYSITAMDANGCTTTIATSITQPQAIAATTQVSPVSCFGGADGTISLLASGGVGNFVYAVNGGAGQQSNIFSNLAAGSYTLIVTDGNGCTFSINDTMTQPDLLVATSLVQNVLCNGQSNGSVTVAVTGGVAPYQYVWNTGDTISSVSNITREIILLLLLI
ncbi:MAG: CUB domain-containing protein [Bacteroidia bacterium]